MTTDKTVFVRIEHSDKPYTRIDNDVIRNKNLSWKARGLLAYLLSHSEGYQVRIDSLHTFSKDGHGATLSGIKELKDAGHMYFVKKQDPQTKQWLAGYWVISERPERPNSLAAENPKSGKPCGRVILRSENRVLYKKDQEEKNNNKKEGLKEKKDFSEKSFDPEGLPVRFEKYPDLVKAWGVFVQHRKDIKKPLTKGAWILLAKKMLRHTPEDIVAELNQAVERGWRTIFYNDKDKASPDLNTSPSQSELPDDNSDYGNMMGIKDKDFVR